MNVLKPDKYGILTRSLLRGVLLFLIVFIFTLLSVLLMIDLRKVAALNAEDALSPNLLLFLFIPLIVITVLYMVLDYQRENSSRRHSLNLLLSQAMSSGRETGVFAVDRRQGLLLRCTPDIREILGLPHGDREYDPVSLNKLGPLKIRSGQKAYPSLAAYITSPELSGTTGTATLETGGRAFRLRSTGLEPGIFIMTLSPATADFVGDADSAELYKRLESALPLAGIAFFYWNLETDSVVCSENFTKIRGIGCPGPSEVQRLLLRNVHPDDRESLEGHLTDCLRQRINGSRYEFRIRNDSEDFRWISETLWGVWDSQGNCSKLISINADITATKEREKELRRARDLAEETNRSKNEFLANMNHEIRTPMNAILGFSEILMKESADQNLRQYAATIKDSGKQLLAMLDNILTLARIEAGRVNINDDDFSTFSLIREVETGSRIAAEKKRLDLLVERDENLPDYLFSDREKIMTVLTRLVDNAIKFTEIGQVTVRFSLHRDSGDDSRGILEISVEDTGIGININQIEAMKTLFTQGEQRSTRKHGGTGLGLTVSSRILDLLSGSLRLSRSHGGGTLAVISLPVGIPGEQNRRDKIHPADADISDILRNKRILSVDDSETNQFLVQQLLSPLPCKVYTALGGREALISFADVHPDIIFMDINMPEMDGWQCLDEMEKSYPAEFARCKVVMISGDDPDEHLDRRRETQGFLTKPFDRQGIQRLFRTLFAGEIPRGTPTGELQSPDEADITPDVSEIETMPREHFIRAISHSNHAYRKAKSRMLLQDIITFASILREESQDYPASKLFILSERLSEAAERFDIHEMNVEMTDYARFLEEVPQRDYGGDVDA